MLKTVKVQSLDEVQSSLPFSTFVFVPRLFSLFIPLSSGKFYQTKALPKQETNYLIILLISLNFGCSAVSISSNTALSTQVTTADRKSTRLNSSNVATSYAV